MKYFCVVSHTHWDREWYMPLEWFKLKLVDLIDHLLATLEKYPAYIFHLDAQTVVLEDYLEYRPSRRETLRRYITEGRLVVGPWYLQNDFYLTSGESTIRNLLEGRRIAASFGNCGKVGYAADQFGNISQLPQILNNFGLDNFVFGRGLADYEVGPQGEVITKTTPSEFIWEGADGSRVLAVHMAFWYNNAQRFSMGFPPGCDFETGSKCISAHIDLPSDCLCTCGRPPALSLEPDVSQADLSFVNSRFYSIFGLCMSRKQKLARI